MNNSIFENLYLEGFELNLKSKNKQNLIKDMFKKIENHPSIIDKEGVLQDLMEREALGSTGIGKSVAIPHAKSNNVTDIIITIGVLEEEIEFDSIDGDKVKLIFMFLTPTNLSREYLLILAKISRYIREDNFRNHIINAKSSSEIYEYIKKLELS